MIEPESLCDLFGVTILFLISFGGFVKTLALVPPARGILVWAVHARRSVVLLQYF